MPVEPVPQMMARARRDGYAVGYFESWNLESLQGVLDAAEQTRSPIIIGFNGEFLSGPGRARSERLRLYGALGSAAAEGASIPCGFIFNECTNDRWTEQAIMTGFNLVMPADPEASLEGYTRRVTDLATIAHAHDVAVEAEVGELPQANERGTPTDPAVAEGFVQATGVDLLAISVGNIHVKLRDQAPLDLDLLARIRERVDVPLVLHGGTGIEADSLREAIRIGVNKVNYGTYLKQRYLDAVRAALDTPEPNPHRLLGMGGAEDVMTVGRRAVCDAVLERIDILGCCGSVDDE